MQNKPVRYFVHPKSSSAGAKLVEFLNLHQQANPGFEVTSRTIEVCFEEIEPAFLVPETVLSALVPQPWAVEVVAFFQTYGERILPFPTFTKRVQSLRAYA